MDFKIDAYRDEIYFNKPGGEKQLVTERVAPPDKAGGFLSNIYKSTFSTDE